MNFLPKSYGISSQALCSPQNTALSLPCIHVEEKHPEDDDSLVCKICDKKLGTVSSLELHIQTIHMGAKKHQCDKCDEVFTFSYQVFQTQQGLKMYMRIVSLYFLHCFRKRSI